MAWTNTAVHKGSAGNARLFLRSIETDGAEAEIKTGLKYIYGWSMGPTSMTTLLAWKIVANKNSSGAAQNGTLGCSGFTNGDKFFLTVWGR